MLTRSRVFHIIHNFDLFISSKVLSLSYVVIYVIHIPELFIAYRALNSWPKVVHVNHSSEIFITSRVLSSRPRVVHVIQSPKLFLTSRAQSSRSWVVHVIHSLNMFIMLTTWSHSSFHDLELFIASRGLSSGIPSHSYHLQLWAIHSLDLELMTWVVHVSHSFKLFIAFRVIGLGPRIINVILNPELFIAFRGVSSWDLESLTPSTMLSNSSIHSLELTT